MSLNYGHTKIGEENPGQMVPRPWGRNQLGVFGIKGKDDMAGVQRGARSKGPGSP